jgi:hypothetical protein
MPAYTAFLLLAHELARRHVRTYVVAQALAMASVPLWIGGITSEWFQVSKVLTTTFPTLVLSVVRIAFQRNEGGPLRFFRGGWTFVFAYSALQVNIVEAVAADLAAGRPWNALTGAVLGLTMANPFGDRAWIIETDTPRRDAIVRVTTAWTCLYTTWNLACLSAAYPVYLAHVACILAAPLTYSLVLRRPDLWMSARVYTLSWGVVVLWSGHDVVTPLMDTSRFGSSAVFAWWGAANAAAATAYLAHWVRARKRTAGGGLPAVVRGVPGLDGHEGGAAGGADVAPGLQGGLDGRAVGGGPDHVGPEPDGAVGRRGSEEADRVLRGDGGGGRL